VVMVSATSFGFGGARMSTESDARLLSVTVPMHPALFPLVRRWQAPFVMGSTSSVASSLAFEALFLFYDWMT
jgi:hypothetical protein